MSSSADNHYDVLGITQDASQKEIKSAYVALARSLHPDKQKFGGHLMKRVNEAYQALSDPNSRYTYDQDMPPPSATATPSPKAKRDEAPPPREHQSDHTTSRPDNEFVSVAKCVVCNHIVSGSVMEAQCCGCLSCADCRPKYSYATCPNKSCEVDNVKWNCSKFMTDYLEKNAPTHECGKRVPTKNLRMHKLVCPHLNTECFRCSGRGSIPFAGTVVECIGCEGKKVLPGKDWIQCFKCQGRGAYDTVSNTTLGCTTCFTKGALHGRWTRCFKCTGVGAFDNTYGFRVSCGACDAAGAFRGFNIVECSSCTGAGPPSCASCKGKGSVPCHCGSSCKGHSDQFTRRVYQYGSNPYYDSDSS